MLHNMVQVIWNIVQIIFCITLITFFFCLIITFIGTTIDNIKTRKIKDKALQKLKKNLDNMVVTLDSQPNKESIDNNSEK